MRVLGQGTVEKTYPATSVSDEPVFGDFAACCAAKS